MLNTCSGYVQTIKGEGLPIFERPTDHGDLYVEYNVVLPTEISPETKKREFLHIFDAVIVLIVI